MRLPESVYRGTRTADGVRVTVDDQAFAPTRPMPGRVFLSGFGWGYGGAGAAQLAHALVLDATGDRHLAAAAHKWLMWAVVSQWGDRWEITAGAVVRWVGQWRKEARTLRRAELYEWACTLAGDRPPPVPVVVVEPAIAAAPPAPPPPKPDPLAHSQPGPGRLIPFFVVRPVADDGLEGGGV